MGQDFQRALAGGLKDGWLDALNDYKAECSKEEPEWATRKASGEALAILTEAIPEMIGGSADLTGSVNTKTPSTEPITSNDFSGRYIHYGVREHAMGAVMNGIALHGGFIPYGGTFLVFADYMKGAMRLSALMKQRVVYVLTHDSIGLGEDGPTHQAVETLAMLRALPNFKVYRPCEWRRQSAGRWCFKTPTAPPAWCSLAKGFLRNGLTIRMITYVPRAPMLWLRPMGTVRQPYLPQAQRCPSQWRRGIFCRLMASARRLSRCRVGNCSTNKKRIVSGKCWARGASGSPLKQAFAWDGTSISVATADLSAC